MTYLVSLALGLSAWLSGKVNREGGPSFTAALLWSWMWLLTWTNTDNPDLEGYHYYYYEDAERASAGPAFWVLTESAKNAGIDYEVFALITAGIAFSLMSLVARWFSPKVGWVALLYFIYPFAFDAIQLRNLLAMSFITLGVGLWLRNRSRSVVWFIILTLFAALLHPALLAYIIFTPIMSRSGHTYARLIAGAAFLGALVTVMMPSATSSLGVALVGFLGSDEKQVYLATDGRLGGLIVLALHLILLIVLRRANSITSSVSHQPDRARLVQFAYRSAMVITAAIPFVMLNSNFYRLIRNLWFIEAVAFTIALVAEEKLAKRTLPPMLLAVVLGLLLVHVFPSYSAVREVFENSGFSALFAVE